jgi:hypothetical protein
MREVMGELGVSIVYLSMASGFVALMAHFIAQIV